MEPQTYKRLLASVTLPASAIPNARVLARAFGVSEETVGCIYAQEVQNRVKRRHAELLESIDATALRFQQGQDLVQLAYNLDLPPCIVARRVLEALHLGLGRAGVTAALRDPAALPSLTRGPSPAPDLVARLQRALADCTDADAVCCPAADAARAAAGTEHEERLYACLQAAGVAFWSETRLRQLGFFKTPDAKLQVPIAFGSHVVHWIDSKATFGDARMHRSLLAGQYELYVNRFGPGLVIYWHGFVADLQQHPGVAVADNFPPASAITRLPCLDLSLGEEEVVAPLVLKPT